jgi:uncharacterized protein YbaP (TraB family)
MTMPNEPRRRRLPAMLAALAVLLCGSAGAAAPEEELDELRVTGEQPGPAMWRVSRGEHTLWIMGTLYPLPAGMTWRSRQAEEVIGRAGEILAPSTSSVALSSVWTGIRNLRAILRLRYNADGATLREVLPADLHERWRAAHRRYFGKEPDPKERARPLYAAQLLLDQAVEKSGLVQRPLVWQRVGELAKQHKVHIRRRVFTTRLDNIRPLIADLAALPRDQEVACLADTLDYIDTELPKMRRRAQAWAVGDIATLRALAAGTTRTSCFEALTRPPSVRELLEKQQAQVEQDWAGIIDWELLTHETSFTALPIDSLLDPKGLLSRLRARGYTVEEPQ